MLEIGFDEKGRYFVHPDTPFFVEFPPGPLMVGLQPVTAIDHIDLPTGKLSILSPTDCIKDRLAAYYHWGDEQCLFQAILINKHAKVVLEDIKRWSILEGKIQEFKRFQKQAFDSD